MLGKSIPSQFIVINYHHVTGLERRKFADQMDHLIRWGSPVSSDFRVPPGKSHRYIAVTADDGWHSFLINAVPELIVRNIPLTIFVVSNRLGETLDGISIDRLISEKELRELAAQNVGIGSHTSSHRPMTAISETDAWDELVVSKTELGEITGKSINSFCFPYGRFNADLLFLARKVGYERVFTTVPEFADSTAFVVGRVRVDPSDWPIEFHLKIMGAYRWLPIAPRLKHFLLGRMRAASTPQFSGS